MTSVDEIADGIYRLSTWVADIAPPAGFTFNQFLIHADQPLLFHTGPRAMFPLVSDDAAGVLPVERLRWITFGHIEADECGSMNQWLAAARHAEVAQGMVGCMVSLNDLADRPPRPLADGEVLDLGGKRVRHIDTPTCPMPGRPESSTKKPPGHCCAGTCSPTSATDVLSPTTTSSNRRSKPRRCSATAPSPPIPPP